MNEHPVRLNCQEPPTTDDPTILRQGIYKGRPVILWQEPGSPNVVLRAELSDGVEWYDYPNPEILERYFSIRYGPIEWK